MKNEEIAKILFEIGDYLDLKNIPFKPKAYQEAAVSLDTLEKDVEDIYKEEGLKGLEEIPGIGESIALKIEEYLQTGRIKYYQELKKEKPIDVKNLKKIQGLGIKKIEFLNKELGIKNVPELKEAIEKNKLKDLKGFGEKSQKNILIGISFMEANEKRFLISDIIDEVNEIVERLKKIKEVKKIEIAGSFRRKKETVGDIDILVASSFPRKIMDEFVTFPNVVKIWGRGETKTSVRIKKGINVDLRVVPENSFGAALQYFTGSKEHNIALRILANSKGYKLNEYGLFKNEIYKVGKNEEDIYKKLGLEYIPPELREGREEIQTAAKHKLPKLVELKDVKGDFHTHSSFAGTNISMEEIVLKAISKGYKYIGISDHTKTLRIENGLDEKELKLQRKEVEKLNKKYGNKIKVFHGAEVNILKDGSLDIKNDVLKSLDFVNIGVHNNFKMSKKEMTGRIIKAMSNPHVTCLVHPTGRIVNRRDSFDLDLEKIFEFAKTNNIALEVNSSDRLDLSNYHIKRAKEIGCKFFINTDTHALKQMDRMEYGVNEARRGWATKEDIINTLSLREVEKFLNKR